MMRGLVEAIERELGEKNPRSIYLSLVDGTNKLVVVNPALFPKGSESPDALAEYYYDSHKELRLAFVIPLDKVTKLEFTS